MDIQAVIDQALIEGRKAANSGKVASYIPELAKANPESVAISVHTLEGKNYTAGEVNTLFSFQSAAKVFALVSVLREVGMGLFERINYEPSGNPFSSMVHLMEEEGIPRNPYINSGAILTYSLLPGKTPKEKIQNFREFLDELCKVSEFTIDEAVLRSETETGDRNRSITYFLKQYQRIENVDVAIETYFSISSILINTVQLSKIGLFLTNKGVDPFTKKRIVSERCCRTVVSLMTTCGMYDEAGRAAIYLGLPCKSAVSGSILAVVPNKMSIAVYSPPLGTKGNSVGGMKMLELLSDELKLSIFG